jgi:hypothetical protein
MLRRYNRQGWIFVHAESIKDISNCNGIFPSTVPMIRYECEYVISPTIRKRRNDTHSKCDQPLEMRPKPCNCERALRDGKKSTSGRGFGVPRRDYRRHRKELEPIFQCDFPNIAAGATDIGKTGHETKIPQMTLCHWYHAWKEFSVLAGR